MTESKKYQAKVEFETFDQGGQFEPLKLPDLSAARKANRDVLMQNFETQEALGLQNLKLEQDKYKAVDAHNKQVWEYIAQSGIDKATKLSKTLESLAEGYVKQKDERDAENALIEFQEAFQNGEIPALEEVLKYDKAEQEAQRIDGSIQADLGEQYQKGAITVDLADRIESRLSPWRSGPHKQRLLLQYYASQIPAYLASTSNTPVYIAALGESYSVAERDKWPKGHAVAIQAAIDKQNIANLVGMFKGFNRAAVAKYITPQIIEYQTQNVVNFADEQTSSKERAIVTDIRNTLTVHYKGDPRDLYNAVQESFAYASKWMPSREAKEVVFAQLKADADAGLLSHDAAQELLDTVMDPDSKKKQTYGEFLGERFLSEYDIVGAARDQFYKKELSKESVLKAQKKQLETDLITASKEYSDANNGAIIPKEQLWEIGRKWQSETHQNPWPILTGMLHAENFDDEYVKETLEHLRQVSGGKLTEEMMRNASPAVRQHFRDKGYVASSSQVPNADLVKSGNSVIKGFVNDYLASTAPGEPGGMKIWTEEKAKRDFAKIYQNNLTNGVPQEQAQEDALAKVYEKINRGDYKFPTIANPESNSTHTEMRTEFAANNRDPSVPIKALESDVEAMVKVWERNGKSFPEGYEIPDSIQLFAKHAQISPQKAAVLQSGGRVDLPLMEVKVTQKLGENNNLVRLPSDTRSVRVSIDNEGINLDLQKPAYQKGEYDSKDSNGVLTNIDIEKLTVGEVINLLESGEISTATGYEFTRLQLLNAYGDSNLNPDTLMTPAIQNILFNHLKVPGPYPHVEPTEEVSFYNSNFLWGGVA